MKVVVLLQGWPEANQPVTQFESGQHAKQQEYQAADEGQRGQVS